MYLGAELHRVIVPHCIPTSYTTMPPCGNKMLGLFLNSQKLVDSRPNSSWVPSNPEKTRNDPLPCFIMFSLSWIPTIKVWFNITFTIEMHIFRRKGSLAHLYFLESQGEEVSGRCWRRHNLKQPQVRESPLPPDLSSLSHLSRNTKRKPFTCVCRKKVKKTELTFPWSHHKLLPCH